MKNMLKLFCKALVPNPNYKDEYDLVDNKGNIVHTGVYDDCMSLKKIKKNNSGWTIRKV